jgi:hypothetical protein
MRDLLRFLLLASLAPGCAVGIREGQDGGPRSDARGLDAPLPDGSVADAPFVPTDAGDFDGGGIDAGGIDAGGTDSGVDTGVPNPCLGVDCSAMTSLCAIGMCNPATGACMATPISEGNSCDTDMSDCIAGTCVAGVCAPSNAPDCNSCASGVCAAGACVPNDSNIDATFEDGTITGFSSGSPSWSTTTASVHSGSRSARSGVIGDYGVTSMTRSVTLTSAGTVSFWYSVSSEVNYDYGGFYIDGALQFERSGAVGWTSASYPLSAGSHTLEWRYDKDVSLSSGSDAMFVDDVIITGMVRCP